MVTADDELQGLLGGDDDEEFPEKERAAGERWDVEKVWKRTRLRIMVYTRLGELEDEDEERYVQQERGLSMDESDDDEAGLVSWASAIFLTSVVEFIAEQTLLVSGQASYARISAKLRKAAQQSDDGEEQLLERIVVEDYDVEKIALNSSLGRLWRTWKKRVRSPIAPLSPTTRGPRSAASLTSLHRRRISHDTVNESILSSETLSEMPEHKPTETEIAANIPIPVGDNDVNEIEVPGLARSFEDEEESSGTQTPVIRPQRPSSVIMLAPAEGFRRRLAKERPVSMPPPEALPFRVPDQFEAQDAVAEITDAETEGDELEFKTPMERVPSDDSYIIDEQQEGMDHVEERGDAEADADMVAFAASTGMGFGMAPVSPTKSATEDDDTVGTPTKTEYAAPQVFRSKRMSIEKTGPPGVVRTYSSRSSRSSHLQTPEPKSEMKSYLDDAHTDDDLSGPEAIGVARTSNIPITATPSPPVDTSVNGEATRDLKQQPDHQGFVELAPRNVAAVPAAMIAPQAPHVEGRSTPPLKSTQRKELSQEKPLQRKVTPPKARSSPLGSVQEAETWTSKPQENVIVKKQTYEPQRGSPLTGSPKHSNTSRARESPIPVPERSARRRSGEGSPRAPTSSGDGFVVEKSVLKRVSSSSSTAKSVSTSILHTGRNSDSSLNRPRGLSGRMSEEDRQREFDSLVKREETVKFTLTPQSVRDMEVSKLAQTNRSLRDVSQEPPVVRKIEPQQSTSSVTIYPRVNADKDNQFGSQPMPSRTASRSKGSTASPGRSSSSKKSIGPRPLAREPRIQTESMRDFADFIRSTGPAPGEERSVQPFVPLSGSASQSPNASSTTVGGFGRKPSVRQASNHSKSNSTTMDGPTAKPRLQMEPRSPAGQRSGNDDLIDFIRQGPPGANNGQPRIPRSVAPFRSTVDSDQFDQMLDNDSNAASAYGSQVSTASKQSANSRTGLLPAPNVVHPAYSNTPQKLTGNMSNPEPQITRTRRRIKDPYAIDLSDEEDDDLLTALPSSSKPQRQEESLMDFLNSMEPPTSTDPKPLLLTGATVDAVRARAVANKSASNSSLPSTSSSVTAIRNGSVRGNRSGAAQSAVVSSSVTSDAPRAHKPKLQARAAGTRDARAGRSATNDLADFLRTSGPPEPTAPAPDATIRKEDTKRSNSRFWRRKERTYPDLP